MSRFEGTDAVTHFLRNAWEPIAVPRWAITIKYLLFVAAGLQGFYSGVGTLDLSTPAGYVPIWAACLSLGAVIGAIGSFRPKWGWIEAIGASVVCVFLAVLVFLVFARGSNSAATLLLIVTIIPGVRALFLVTRIVLAYARREEWPL